MNNIQGEIKLVSGEKIFSAVLPNRPGEMD